MGRSAIRDVAQERLPQLTAYLRVLLLLSSMGRFFGGGISLDRFAVSTSKDFARPMRRTIH